MASLLKRSGHQLARYAIALCVMIPLGGCSTTISKTEFKDRFPWPKDTPVLAVDPTIVFKYEEPDSFAVLHGFACAKSEGKGEKDFVRMQQIVNLDDILDSGGRYITNATVFLNGWRVDYLDEHHHLLGFGAAIVNIELDRFKLNWEAGGALAEDGFDSDYSWCYDFTIVAWNDNRLDMHVDHRDEENTFWNVDSYQKNTTAVHVLPNYRQNVPFVSSDTTVTVLPRAFGLAWPFDYHVLQTAYNLDHSEAFVQSGRAYGDLDPPALPDGVARVDSESVSWDSKFILKDNKARRDFYAAEIVSIFGGTSVGVIQPPFTITPAKKIASSGGIIGSPPGEGGLKTEDVVIENIPFDYAIPVLSGWSLRYSDDDHHVQDIGARIESFSYEKNPGAATGTLRYTISSILDDQKNGRVTRYLHRVNILGWNAASAGVSGPHEIEAPDGNVEVKGPGS